jgi:hypothetical protein
MSLDTVLRIGKAFRSSENGLKHFRYVNPCPKDTDKQSITRLCLPVKEDFSFDFDNLSEITNQNIIGSDTKDTELYYLTFKTSDSDGMVKYIFGDILYGLSSSINKNGIIERKEEGYYRLDDPNSSKKSYSLNSFYRGREDFDKLLELLKKNENNDEMILVKFRNAYEKNIKMIHNILEYQVGVKKFFENKPKNISFQAFLNNENLLKEYLAWGNFENIKTAKNNKKVFAQIFGNEQDNYEWEKFKDNKIYIEKLIQYSNSTLFLHFSFFEKEHWYSFKNELNIINQKILDDFVEKSKSVNGFVLNKTLYKTLCSGQSKNDIQFPNFDLSSKHKSKFFTIDAIQDLFYAIDYSKKATINPTENVKLIILPNGENLMAIDYENFNSETQKLIAESLIDKKNTESQINDILLSWFDDSTEQDSIITSFDMIFSKKGGLTSPDTDLIELSGIKKSALQIIRERIYHIINEIYDKRQKELNINKKMSSLSISWSLTNILGSCQTDTSGKVQFKPNPKYNSHLLKILPKIYTSNYTQDNLLLPAFIENVEYSIRQGESKFSFLKYDLEFLLSIQNVEPYKTNYMKIVESESYQLGLLLGKMAQPFSGENSPIRSFEKNYVGNLTRRIPTLKEFIALKNEIEEKLIMHEKVGFTKNLSIELSNNIKSFKTQYDKNECVFGFFEGYFSRTNKKNLVEKVELLLEKDKSEENAKIIEKIQVVINEYKS